MSRTFATSDSHFGHDREFLYAPRGFTSIQEHDEEVIRRWNATVNPDDIVYHLGDVMLGDNEHGMECLSRLNGTIYIVPGNHDTLTRLQLYKTLPNVHVIESGIPGMTAAAATIKYKKYSFYLSHHPTMTSNLEKAPYLRMHLINLFGHTHQQKKFYNDMPYMFHVGMDSNNCTPVLLDDAIEMMKEETKKCIELLQEECASSSPEMPTGQPSGASEPAAARDCTTCEWRGTCLSAIRNRICQNYAKEIKDGGFYR